MMLLFFSKDRDLNAVNAILSFSFTLATAFGLGALMKIALKDSESETEMLTLVLAVILVLLNIILYIMMNQTQNLLKHKYELAMINKQRDFERSRMDEANTIWGNIRKLKHDLKNHFAVIRGLLEEEKYDAGMQYLSELDNTVNSMGNLIQSGNTVVDYIINSKLSGLDGVQVIVSGYVGSFSYIEDIDMVSILGNILDNAIEAQEGVTGEKRIELLFLQKNTNQIIICKNSVSGSVLNNNRFLSSTKKSPELHGFGHQIVEAAVKKYGGIIDYFEENDVFGVQIILPERT
jgi:signal transduction histidine kinase